MRDKSVKEALRIEYEEDEEVELERVKLEEEIKVDQEERAANPELAQKYDTVFLSTGPKKQYFGVYNEKTKTVEEEYGADEDWENLSEYSRDDKNLIQEDH
jgi:hypothetical protein